MDNTNYYFLQIVSSTSDLTDKWNETQINTTANLLIGDIINFKAEKFNTELISDFGAEEFLVIKRVFLYDSSFENVGGVFLLYLQPIIN